jgi:predicted ferric reductase
MNSIIAPWVIFVTFCFTLPITSTLIEYCNWGIIHTIMFSVGFSAIIAHIIISLIEKNE